MIELRKHIEGIVRPIRASNLRKDRMREELLAHLTTIYEEELAEQPEDAAGSMAVAVERFGDPAALREELQASVSWLEKLMCTSFPPHKGPFARRPGETTRAHVRRNCLKSMAINAAIWAALLLFLGVMTGLRAHRVQDASLAWLTAFAAAYVFCLFPVSVFGMMLLGDKTWRAWRETRNSNASHRRRAAVEVLGCLLVSMAIYAAIAATILVFVRQTIQIPLVSDSWFWGIIVMSSMLGPPFLLLQIPDLNRWHMWEGLVLDERTPPSS